MKKAKPVFSHHEAEYSDSENDDDDQDAGSSQPLTTMQSSQLVAAVGLSPPIAPAPQGIHQTRLVESLEAPIISSTVLQDEDLRRVFFRGKIATFNEQVFAATQASIEDSPRFMRQIFCGNPEESDANRNYASTFFNMDLNRDDSLKKFFLTMVNVSRNPQARAYTVDSLIKSTMDKIGNATRQAALNSEKKPYKFMCVLREAILSATALPEVAAALDSEWLVEPITADSRKLNILIYKNLIEILPKEISALYRALYPKSNGHPPIADRKYSTFLLDFERNLMTTIIALEEGRTDSSPDGPSESRTYGGKMMDSILAKRPNTGGDGKRNRFDSGDHEAGDISCHRCGRRGHKSYECSSTDEEEEISPDWAGDHLEEQA